MGIFLAWQAFPTPPAPGSCRRIVAGVDPDLIYPCLWLPSSAMAVSQNGLSADQANRDLFFDCRNQCDFASWFRDCGMRHDDLTPAVFQCQLALCHAADNVNRNGCISMDWHIVVLTAVQCAGSDL